jgi:hypothetical protein
MTTQLMEYNEHKLLSELTLDNLAKLSRVISCI